ncbi:MAG: hypothetical protein AB7N71_09750 [Phycisphaerae bacterium]
MSRWGYYSPLWVGFVIGLILLKSTFAQGPEELAWVYWGKLLAGAVILALVTQLGMLGAQGAFAQVLPAPGGKSIRGRVAVVAGIFVLGAIVASAVAGFLYADRNEGTALASMIVAGLAGAMLISAAIAYFWGMPAAVEDFGGKD